MPLQQFVACQRLQLNRHLAGLDWSLRCDCGDTLGISPHRKVVTQITAKQAAADGPESLQSQLVAWSALLHDQVRDEGEDLRAPLADLCK